MPWRFRKSMKILPGVRVNLGKRGASVSVGGRIAGMTVGPSGVRERVSLPGTGLSYSQKVGGTTHRPTRASGGRADGCGCRTLGIGAVALLGLAAVIGVCGQLTPGKPAANPPSAPTTPLVRPGSTSTSGETSPLEPIDLTATAQAIGLPAPKPIDPTAAAQPVRSGGLPVGATAATPGPTGAAAAASPTPAATATPAPPPGPVAGQDANLRSGPGTDYPVIGYVKAGQTLDIAACNADGTWFELAGKPWIYAPLVQNGRCPRVESNIALPPPPPTFTPVPAAGLSLAVPSPVAQPVPPPPPARSCCRICTSGKACGDGCIPANKTCHQPPGCACNG